MVELFLDQKGREISFPMQVGWEASNIPGFTTRFSIKDIDIQAQLERHLLVGTGLGVPIGGKNKGRRGEKNNQLVQKFLYTNYLPSKSTLQPYTIT